MGVSNSPRMEATGNGQSQFEGNPKAQDYYKSKNG